MPTIPEAGFIQINVDRGNTVVVLSSPGPKDKFADRKWLWRGGDPPIKFGLWPGGLNRFRRVCQYGTYHSARERADPEKVERRMEFTV